MNKNYVRSIGLILCLIFSQSTFFIVNQGQQAMISRLGNLQASHKAVIKYQPGIHIKLPLVDTVIFLDTRLQSFAVPSSRMITGDQKSVDVDYFVKWRIHDMALYYTRTAGNKVLAQGLLIRKVNDLVRASFGDKALVELIADNRQNLMTLITAATNDSSKDIGVEVIDVRIKSIDYPKEVTLSVYQRMKTQREQVAKMYRANGEMKATEIEAEANKESSVIKANASLAAAEIKAKGDKDAANITNKAYIAYPKFYKFWRLMKAYEVSLKKQTVFVLNAKQDDILSSLLADKSIEKS